MNQKFEVDENLLPFDGVVHYCGLIINESDSAKYLQNLLKNIQWKHDESKIFGRHIITKRKAAWYGNDEYSYTYSGTTKVALPWTPELTAIKKIVEEKTGTKFNSCLLNLYHNGNEGMTWHSDDEKILGKNTVIASVSLGASRKFAFKHKGTKETISTILENGSLLVMKGTTQNNWLHCLPKTVKVLSPRINLTFRTIST